MARELFEYREENSLRIIKLMLSDDWASLTPWAHEGENVPWWGRRVEKQEGPIRVIFVYFGPFAVIAGEYNA